jgi:hypothetical protein
VVQAQQNNKMPAVPLLHCSQHAGATLSAAARRPLALNSLNKNPNRIENVPLEQNFTTSHADHWQMTEPLPSLAARVD